jgi:hypothetical protein
VKPSAESKRRLDEAGWTLVVIWEHANLIGAANESQNIVGQRLPDRPAKAGLGQIRPSTDLSNRSIS